MIKHNNQQHKMNNKQKEGNAALTAQLAEQGEEVLEGSKGGLSKGGV